MFINSNKLYSMCNIPYITCYKDVYIKTLIQCFFLKMEHRTIFQKMVKQQCDNQTVASKKIHVKMMIISSGLITSSENVYIE